MDVPLIAWPVFAAGGAGLLGCHAFAVMAAHEAAERLVAPAARARAARVAGAAAVLAGAASALLVWALEVGDRWPAAAAAVGAAAGAGRSAVALRRARTRPGPAPTFARRMERPSLADFAVGLAWLFTSGVMGIFVLMRFAGVTEPDAADLAALAILGASFLAGPAAMLLRYGNLRRARRTGAEPA
ncbi:hypothetical protein AB0L25_13160 [Spirillospora sp. NPDC052242]